MYTPSGFPRERGPQSGVNLPSVWDVTDVIVVKEYNACPAMIDEQDWPLYDLWRIAIRKGYSLRLEGNYIRLVPLTTQGDSGLVRTFPWSNDGIKKARAGLESPGTPQRVDAANRMVQSSPAEHSVGNPSDAD